MTSTISSSPPSSPPTSSWSGEPVLDLTGEVCPYTFVRARLALEELPLGALLVLEGDHPPARLNVPRSARAWGQEVVAVEDAGPARWRIVLRKLVE